MDEMTPEQPSIERLKYFLINSSELAFQLSSNPLFPGKLLKQYTSIYTQLHHHSQQSFTLICQHKFMILLLENYINLTDPISILQCLNLLLSNTKQPQQLAYFLSQNSIHNYLFSPNILQHDTDFIEYYVQLLKTIILKISQHQQNKSLLRMFCNTKYPHFPLLTFATILAGDYNQLIRVTAQQCILILANMINQTKIYSIYLSQPPMLVFIVRLATQFLKLQSDHQGICKYLADLMYQLRSNKIALLLINNIICNVIIIPSLPHQTATALKFLQLFSKSIEIRMSDDKLKQNSYNIKNQSSYQNLIYITSTYYRILIKYMTNKFVTACYLSTFVQFSSLNTQSDALPLKIGYPNAQLQYKILQQYSIKKYIDQQQQRLPTITHPQFLQTLQKKLMEYSKSKQFEKIKQSFQKKCSKTQSKIAKNNSSFLSKIWNRNSFHLPFNNYQYFKFVADATSVTFVKGQPISINLAKRIIPGNLAFMSQYINLTTFLQNGFTYKDLKSGQETTTCQINQMHFNNIRDNWKFNVDNLSIIWNMTEKSREFGNYQLSKTNTIFIPKTQVPPCDLFLRQLKDYLSLSLHLFIQYELCTNQVVNSTQTLAILSKITRCLKIQPNDNSIKHIMNKLIKKKQQLQNSFSQNNWIDIIEYIKIKNNQIRSKLPVKSKINQNKSKNNNNNNNNNKNTYSNSIFFQFSAFQQVSTIIDFNMKPLIKQFQRFWKTKFNKEKQNIKDFYQETFASYKIFYLGKDSTLVFVKLITPPTIQLRIQLDKKKLVQLDLLQLLQIKKSPIDSCLLQFIPGTQNIKSKTQKQADEIISNFTYCKTLLKESITNVLMQYLCNRGKCLNQKISQISQISISSTIHPNSSIKHSSYSSL